MIPFSAGGYVLVWEYSGIRAQRFDASGLPVWTPGGIQLSGPGESVYTEFLADIGSDGSLLVVYEVLPDPPVFQRQDFRAMRVDSTGAALWPASVGICTGLPDVPFSGDPRSLSLVESLGDGSMIVVWTDRRDGQISRDIFAQRIEASGAVTWAANGRELMNVPSGGLVTPESLIPDGSGGCFIALDDRRADGLGDIRLLRLAADGSDAAGWAGGRVVSNTTFAEYAPVLLRAGGGGFRLAFNRSFGARLQKFDAEGDELWESGGRAVWPGYNYAYFCAADDGSDGVIMAAVHDVSGSPSAHKDIRATRLGPEGEPLWGPDGVAVSTAAYDQYNPRLAPDGSGGAFVVWEDQRAGPPEVDIYAQHINADGTLGGAVTAISVAAVAGARHADCAEVEWTTTESAGTSFEVERSDEGAPWRSIAQRFPDGLGRIRWNECGLPAAQRIEYRLHWDTPSGSRFSAPFMLLPEVPMTWSLQVVNPVTDRAAVEFSLPARAQVRLEVFDIAGRRVATPASGLREAGQYRLEWEPRDAEGQSLASGAYVLRLIAGEDTLVQRMILAR